MFENLTIKIIYSIRISLFIWILFLQVILLNAQIELPLDTLSHHLKSVKRLCDQDNGKLWDINLTCPILIIDPLTKNAVTNEPTEGFSYSKIEDIYVGKVPSYQGGSTSLNWAGKSWATIQYPINLKDTFEFYATCIHESFHCIQKKLGLNCGNFENSHMDNMISRIYLNLEWQALLAAVNSTDSERKIAIREALLFRQQRRKKFLGSDTMENKFEILEGLADYTANKICCKSNLELKEEINRHKANNLNLDGSYVRIFGYYSGFLYGYLLDEYMPFWKKNLNCSSDLGLILQNALQLDISKDTTDWFNQSKNHNCSYKELYTNELGIHNNREKYLNDFKDRITHHPILTINLLKEHQFVLMKSPFPLDSTGEMYPQIIILDEWGKFEVLDNGCLITNDQKVIVPCQNLNISGKIITGSGWKLELNDHWNIVKQRDNYVIVNL